jgi:hypothetical protein
MRDKLITKHRIETIPNYRKFNVYILGPTNHLGTRVKITEPKRYYNDETSSVILPYDYEIGNIANQALQYLIKKGFNPVARCSEYKCYTILCDNWGKDYINLKTSKNENDN